MNLGDHGSRPDMALAAGEACAPAQVRDLLLHRTLSSVEASDRGWAFALGRADADADTVSTSVWHCGLDGDLREIDAAGHGAVWYGDRIAYLRQTTDGAQVVLRAPGDGDSQPLTRRPGGIASIEHADPIGERMLVTVVRTPSDDEAWRPIVCDGLPFKADGVGYTCGRTIELGCVDACTGTYRTLVGEGGEGGDVVEARWDPGGRRIALVRRRAGPQRHWMDLWLRERDGALRCIIRSLPTIGRLVWSPDGRRIAMAASAIEGDSISHLHVVDVASGRVDALPVELCVPASLQWASAGDALLVVEACRGTRRLVRVDPGGNTLTLHADPSRQVFEAAAVAGRIGFVAAGPDDGPEFWIADACGGDARPVSRFNAWRRRRPLLHARRRRFAVPDGEGGTEDIEGWLMLPPGGGPFPVLLDVHGGPHSHVGFEFERIVHWPVLLQRGWAVLALEAAGSSGRGAAFARRVRGRWGELDWPQWQAAVRQLQDDGQLSRRVAVFGHSYGGYLAAWALAHDATLAGGIASAPVANLESHAGTSDTGYYVGPYAMAGELADRRARYRALSPVSLAHRIRAPLLLLQGQDDHRCPVGQSEELFSAVLRNGRTRARMMLFPGADHHLSTTGRPSHRLAYYEALVSWLEDACVAPAEDAPRPRSGPSAERPRVRRSA
jgi:dipeptidyl aminopeptidase/acylaminoacyl peptidase